MLSGPHLLPSLRIGLLLSLLAPLALPVPVEADPLGLWKGRGNGEGALIPPEGVDFQLAVRRAGSGIEARLTLHDQRLKWTPAQWDAETAVLDMRVDMMGVAIELSAEVQDETLTGKARGLGLEIELEAELVTRTLPPEAEEATSPASPVPLDRLGLEDWTADLRFLADQLPAEHKNAFHSITREEWDAAVDETDRALPDLDPFARMIALARLVARVGDAHTGLGWNSVPGMTGVPIRLQFFADGLFVTSIHEDFAEALATRVVSIGGHSVDEVVAAVKTTFAAENSSWVRMQVQTRLAIPMYLRAAGIGDSDRALVLRVDAEGEELEVTVEARDARPQLVAPDPAFDPLPTWQRNTNRIYWTEMLESGNALYLAYNACAEDPARPMAAFFDTLLSTFDEQGADRLIIDLRHNSGGNSSVLSSQFEKLQSHPVLSQPNRIVVLTGPVTYSSGMMNAMQLRTIFGAPILGEPTGGKPNSYGEVRWFPLPKCGLPVYYSTKYFQMLSDEDPPAVIPDISVEMTSEDYFGGNDPVLEAALGLPLDSETEER